MEIMTMPSVAGTDYRARILASLDRLPPFSPVLTKVMASLANEDVSFSGLASLIENDTVLAGTLLRVVNSPLYGRRATVNSIQHALTILGITKVRNLVLGLSVTKRWATAKTPSCWSTRQFNLHSLACGVMADQIALRTPVEYGEGAFAAGLLHDIGRLLMAIAIPAEYESVYALAKSANCRMNDLEIEHLGVSHADISGEILERWNLPAPIRLAVTCHHHPEDGHTLIPNLAYLVGTADHFVTALGYTLEPGPSADSESEIPLETMESFKLEFDALRSVV